MIPRLLRGAGAVSLVAACGGSDAAPIADLSATLPTPAPATVLRLPADGGSAGLYRATELTRTEWEAEDELPAIERLVGGDLEQQRIFLIDEDGQLRELDLGSGRLRTYLSDVQQAVVGPTGAVFARDSGTSVTRVLRRAATPLEGGLKTDPMALYGTIDNELLAVTPGGLAVLRSDQPIESVAIPTGPTDAAFWGDLLAVGTDTAVVLYAPEADRFESVEVPGPVNALVFSPSGHRIYVATAENADILVLDRFNREILNRIEIPGPARALRVDRYGQWLLARPADGDSLWVVDLVGERYAGSTLGSWEADLPVAMAPTVLLVRRGGDVIALDLSSAGFPEMGRVEGGADDLWFPVYWLPGPGSPGSEPAEPDDTEIAEAEAADSLGPGAARIYLQVSSSRNPDWAQDLVNQMQSAGLPASILQPTDSGDAYRVVLGPYGSRSEAEETSRRLNRPSFIITAQDSTAQ